MLKMFDVYLWTCKCAVNEHKYLCGPISEQKLFIYKTTTFIVVLASCYIFLNSPASDLLTTRFICFHSSAIGCQNSMSLVVFHRNACGLRNKYFRDNALLTRQFACETIESYE